MRVMLALALLAWGTPAAPKRPASAAEVAAQVQQIRQSANFRASGRLVKVDGQGKREAYQIAIQVSAGAAGLKSEYEITAPEPARMRISIETRGAAPAVVRVARGTEKALRTLPFAEWGEAVLNTDLSYEDIIDDQFRWSRQSLAPQATYGARRCFVLKSEPRGADRAHYAQVTSWLDEKILHPVKVEKVMGAGGAVKEFLYYTLRKTAGLWSASQIEVRTRGREGSTFLIITRGSAEKARSAQ